MKPKEERPTSVPAPPSPSEVPSVPIDLAPLAPKSIQHGRFTYAQARQCLSDPLIEEVTEQVHVTLGWQYAGRVERAVSRLMNDAVGHYRPKIDAVPIAIGAIKFRNPIFILEDHNCVHVDFDVRMIVLKVNPGDDEASNADQWEITGTARKVYENKLISGTAYGCLGLVCSPVIPGVKPGDTFKARFVGFQFQKNLCQIRAAPLNIKRF
ncbi:hypothetical protein niasHT_003066 [Heterodera trifolii]|uniref:Uncharacterized protein n=1 Tax=Heterodera trifolii TaxID=157864 RepID=A0ABD2M722_9BILA